MEKLTDFILVENVVPTEFCDELVEEISNNHTWGKHSYHPGFKRPTAAHFPPTEFEFLDAEEHLSLKLCRMLKRL